MHYLVVLFIAILFYSCTSEPEAQQTTAKLAVDTVPQPLFIDPNYHGSCDPEIVWNAADSSWYIYYTARRPQLENTWLQTPIGVIRSANLTEWEFLGYCRFDGVGGKKDAEATYWAPAILAQGDQLHMFVTYKSDTLPIKNPWGGGPGKIVHYETALTNPVDGWTKVADMHGPELSTIDATVYETGDSIHLWFKGKPISGGKNELYHLTSSDLYQWNERGFSQSDVFNAAVTGHGFEEAPYIFEWQNRYWLITDPHKGLLVYESTDGENWNYQSTILEEGGNTELDGTMARHCSVAVIGDRAFIIYHVEPWRRYDLEAKEGPERVGIPKQPLKNRQSVLQLAELFVVDGKLVCDRNQPIQRSFFNPIRRKQPPNTVLSR